MGAPLPNLDTEHAIDVMERDVKSESNYGLESLVIAQILKYCPNLRLGDRMQAKTTVMIEGRVYSPNRDILGVIPESINAVTRQVNLPVDEADFEGIKIPGRYFHPYEFTVITMMDTMEKKAFIRYGISFDLTNCGLIQVDS